MNTFTEPQIDICCISHPNVGYLQQCLKVIASYEDCSIKDAGDLIQKLAENYVFILNDINAQIVKSMIVKSRENTIVHSAPLYVVKFYVDKDIISDFEKWLYAIDRYVYSVPSFYKDFKAAVLAVTNFHKPILEECQTDNTGALPVRRKIELSSDLLPYKSIIFLE